MKHIDSSEDQRSTGFNSYTGSTRQMHRGLQICVSHFPCASRHSAAQRNSGTTLHYVTNDFSHQGERYIRNHNRRALGGLTAAPAFS